MADEGARHSVTVEIAGERHTLRTNADPEYTRRCATVVDDRIAQVRKHARFIEGSRAAILAALSIADEFLRARDELDDLRREVSERVGSVADRIEESLATLDEG